MQSHSKQQGSIVHIVVIIALVVAVLGLLGFVFWNNFLNKKPATTASTNTTSTTQTNQATAAHTLAIKDWGVEGNYIDASVDFVSVIDSASDANTADITDSKLATINGCQEAYAAGLISRMTADQQIYPGTETASQRYDEFVKTNNNNDGYFAISHVGNYYYMYTSPQASCTDDVTARAIQTAASLAAAEVVKSLHVTE